MLEFRMYPVPPPRETDPPMCVVTYPERCGWIAEGEVWALPFCRKHGAEAVAAARLEAYEDAGRELDRLMGGFEGEHAVKNPLVYEALKGARLPGASPNHDHGELIRAAYALREADTDPETLRFDYAAEIACDTPHDWWCESREMIVGFMREAYEANQPHLVEALEPIREHATVQQELAMRDMDMRWAQPRRAAREERQRTEPAGHAPAEILAATNGALSSAIDLLETLPKGGPFDAEAVRRASQAIAEAGGLVCTEERRVFVAEESQRREERALRPVE